MYFVRMLPQISKATRTIKDRNRNVVKLRVQSPTSPSLDQLMGFFLRTASLFPFRRRPPSPLNPSAEQQRAYFDGFGITTAAAFPFIRLAEPWGYSNTALIDWPGAGFNSAGDSFPFRHHSPWHTHTRSLTHSHTHTLGLTAWSAAGMKYGKHKQWNNIQHDSLNMSRESS